MQQTRNPTQLDAKLDIIDACKLADPETALKLCEQAFSEARQLHEHLAQVMVAERYATIMESLARHVKARDTLFEAVQLAQSTGLFLNEARLLELIARGYYSAGEYRQAIQYWAQCVDASDQADRDAMTWILAKIGLGQIYFALNDFDSGLALLNEAESRIHEVDDPHLDAKIKINVGVGLSKTNRGIEARAILRHALQICEAHDFFDYASESNFRLAEIELADGELDAALIHLDIALPLARRVKYYWGESYLLTVRAEVFAHRGEHALALENITVAKAISKAHDYGYILIQQHFAAARYAKAIGNFDAALTEFREGYDLEHQMSTGSLSERNQYLEEQAGLRPSISQTMVELSNDHRIEDGQLDAAFQLIALESSAILKVARASIWLLDAQTGTLVCRCMYLADQKVYTRETSWRREDCPVYFRRLADHTPLVAHDATHHPHTLELEEFYLNPRNIKSMLMFPIRLASQTTGILCLEAVGAQRNWTPDDIIHGNQLAQVSARAIASYEHKQLQQEITALNVRMMQANEMLEARVIERTTSLERHSAELHALNDKVSDLRNHLAQQKKMADFGTQGHNAALKIVPTLNDAASRLSSLEHHHTALLALLADYETAEAGLPDMEKSRLAKCKLECGLDYLRADLSYLTQDTKQSVVRVQNIVSKLRDVPVQEAQ